MKVNEAIFLAKCEHGKFSFYNKEDLFRFSKENDVQDVVITIKLKAKTSEKMRMYAFYHGPLLECAVIGYTMAGYPGIDKVKADYLLRAEFAKDYIKKPNGDYQVVMIDRSAMTKPRFHKYLQDCCFYIEQELQQLIPDSEEWKVQKSSGRKYRRAKQDEDIPPGDTKFMPPDISLI